MNLIFLLITFFGVCLGCIANADTDFYSETYTNPFSQNLINYDRIFESFNTSSKKDNSTNSIYLGVEYYYDSYYNETTAFVGERVNLSKNLSLDVSLREEQLSSALSRINLRTGLIYGNFKFLTKHTFFEVYGEYFYDLPQFTSPFLTWAGWANLGYRFIQVNHFTFDPLIVGVRDSDNSNPSQLGVDYQMLQVGSQAGFYFKKPNASARIQATKAFVNSRTSQPINDYWVLLGIEVKF